MSTKFLKQFYVNCKCFQVFSPKMTLCVWNFTEISTSDNLVALTSFIILFSSQQILIFIQILILHFRTSETKADKTRNSIYKNRYFKFEKNCMNLLYRYVANWLVYVSKRALCSYRTKTQPLRPLQSHCCLREVEEWRRLSNH